MTKEIERQTDQLMLPLICTISFSVAMMSFTSGVYLPITLGDNGFQFSKISSMFLLAGWLVWSLKILVGVVGDYNFGTRRTSHLFLLVSLGIGPFAIFGVSLLDPGQITITLLSISGLIAGTTLIPFVLNIFLAQIASNSLERLRFFLFSSALSLAGMITSLIATSFSIEFGYSAINILFVPAILFLICLPLLWNRIPAIAAPLPSGSLIKFLKSIKSDKTTLPVILLGFASTAANWTRTGFIHERYASLYNLAGILLLFLATLALIRIVRTKELTTEALLSSAAKWAAITSALVLVGILVLGDIATLLSQKLHAVPAVIFSVTLLALIGDIAAKRKTATRVHNFAWYFFLFWISSSIGSHFHTAFTQFAKAIENYEDQIMSAIALIIWSSIVWVIRRVELSPHRPGV